MDKLSINPNGNTTITEDSKKIQSKWSNPPRDILTNLLRYIDLTIDLPRLRAVNPSWRDSLSLTDIPTLPSRLSVPSFKDVDAQSGLVLLLIESPLYHITPRDGNAKPWLAKMLFLKRGKWHLLNPFNLQDYFHALPSVHGEISLLDCNVVEVARPWSLIGFSGGETISKKVVGGWNVLSEYIFAVLVQLEKDGSLVFKRIGDENWVRIENAEGQKGYRMLDIGYFDGKFYAVELNNWKVGVINPEKSSISMEFMNAPGVLGEEVVDNCFTVLIDGCTYGLGGVYLVPSKTRLYLVFALNKVGSESTNVMVFILKEEGWERVMSLGDETLFIGKDVSFGVSKLGTWKENSICFFIMPFPMLYDGCDREFRGMPEGLECINMLSFPRYWLYLKMYNMEEEEKGIERFENLSMEEYTGLFFPPPAWVKWRCPSLDNVEVSLHNVKFSDDMFDKDSDNDDNGDGGRDDEGNGGSGSGSGSGDTDTDETDGCFKIKKNCGDESLLSSFTFGIGN